MIANVVIQASHVGIVGQVVDVVFKRSYVVEPTVYLVLQIAPYAVPRMQQCLRLDLLRKELNDVVLHNLEHLVGIALHTPGHSLDYPLEHQQILHLGHLGHIDVTAAQILDLALGAPVAVDDTSRFEVVYLLPSRQRLV